MEVISSCFQSMDMEIGNENDSEAAGAGASADAITGQNFAGVEASIAENTDTLNAVESTPHSTSGIEDLIKDSP
ncbi:hypothetical protein Lal_00019151 [Lupinus albus]|nr:hypothetical protein Lal_00019151 [Lupinus albus]